MRCTYQTRPPQHTPPGHLCHLLLLQSSVCCYIVLRVAGRGVHAFGSEMHPLSDLLRCAFLAAACCTLVGSCDVARVSAGLDQVV
jgi:hypothetical protein